MTRLSFDIKNNDFIVWRGQVVMSRSEEPYFEKLFARLSLELRPKRVLEVGFGLGISASLIQQHLHPEAHHIVEIDESIYKDLEYFSARHSSVTAILGDSRVSQLAAPYDLVFNDPFYYSEEERDGDIMEARLLRTLTGPSGVLCHPHFGDGEPREIPGFRNVILEKYEVPPISMADGTHCSYAAAVLCYPVL